MTNEQLEVNSQGVLPKTPVIRQDGVVSQDSQFSDFDYQQKEETESEPSEYDFVTKCGREFHFANVDKECQQLIEKISGEKCLRCNGYTLFESFPTFLKEFLSLEVYDDDVWVCSFPRSGKFHIFIIYYRGQEYCCM